MKKTILSLFATTILCACGTDPLVVPNGSTVIDVAQAMTKNTLDISNFTESTRLVALKTPKEAMQSVMTNAELYDNKIFTFDALQTKKVNVYTINGKYLFSVGKIGRGPQELTNISNFSIQNKQIFLTCVLDTKTQVFSTDNGKYIRTMNYPFMASEVNTLSDNRYIFALTDYNTPMGGEYLTNSVVVTDSVFNPIAFGAAHTIANTAETITRSQWNTSFGNKYYSVYSENIYQYNLENDSILCLYSFDFGRDNMPNKAREDINHYNKHYESKRIARPSTSSPVIVDNYVFAQIKEGDSNYFLVHKDGNTQAIEVDEGTYTLTNPIFILGSGVDKNSQNVLISNVNAGQDTDALKAHGIDYNDDVTEVLLLTTIK